MHPGQRRRLDKTEVTAPVAEGLVTDATIQFADDLRQFEGKVGAAGKTYTYTGRKL